MKKMIYLSDFINGFGALCAQQSEIKGRITDNQTNEPLQGASVEIKKSSKTFVSNKEGNFIFSNVPSGRVWLIVS